MNKKLIYFLSFLIFTLHTNAQTAVNLSPKDFTAPYNMPDYNKYLIVTDLEVQFSSKLTYIPPLYAPVQLADNDTLLTYKASFFDTNRKYALRFTLIQADKKFKSIRTYLMDYTCSNYASSVEDGTIKFQLNLNSYSNPMKIDNSKYDYFVFVYLQPETPSVYNYTWPEGNNRLAVKNIEIYSN
jgi:hypothetical protein